MADSIYIDSEIGALEKVIIHTPGAEIENMTPDRAEEELYNDIVPLAVMQKEHAELSDLLKRITRTYEVADLFVDVLSMEGKKREFLQTVAGHYPFGSRVHELEGFDPGQLAQAIISGLPARKDTLVSFISDRDFDLPPIPNLYFMRDSALVYRGFSVVGAMATQVRFMESLITRFIFTYHPEFSNTGLLVDGPALKAPGFTAEGGDFLVLTRNILAVGLSERTSPAAVDRFAQEASAAVDEPVVVFAVRLPKKRATIHLDMVFTMIDTDKALVYEPIVLGRDRCEVIELCAYPSGETAVRQVPSLLAGLSDRGLPLEPILCGGKSRTFQDREQWMSGANSFAFAPGKIIGYGCNEKTFEELDKAGFAIRQASDFIEGRDSVDAYSKLAIGFNGVELARGGGGARCMTLPVKRAPLTF
jgi:arginine deiminase